MEVVCIALVTVDLFTNICNCRPTYEPPIPTFEETIPVEEQTEGQNAAYLGGMSLRTGIIALYQYNCNY